MNNSPRFNKLNNSVVTNSVVNKGLLVGFTCLYFVEFSPELNTVIFISKNHLFACICMYLLLSFIF